MMAASVQAEWRAILLTPSFHDEEYLAAGIRAELES